jgi:hypothetical protein
MARATGPFLVEEAEISRRVFRKQTFLENFPVPFPDKDLGHGALRHRTSKSAQ